MRKVRLARVLAININPLRDIGRDTNAQLHNRILKDQDPLPSIPSQPIPRRPPPLPLRHLQSAEEELPLAVVRADELEQQQEEVSQREGLHDVGPGRQVEVGGRGDLADELGEGDDGDEHADAEDLELLAGAGEVRRVAKHEEGDGEDGEGGRAAGYDGR